MIWKVYRWSNGMVMAFEERGNQMPEYQGPYEEVVDKILADASEDTVFFRENRNNGGPVDREMF